MSIRKPVIRKPKVPKIKKPLISKRKRIVKKSPSLSLGRVKTKITPKKPVLHKKTTTKTALGTCYVEKNCKGVIARKVTKAQCKSQGGKSWKKSGGTCEKL
ncbi:hypothetical protein [Nitrosopumilus adriaticus]|uniref:Uncharacterized protein n=1 Tax=Nitrosopumilus adriaticus TaxID=1580092 RepID=A0A0D5C3S4_9ARCH|nr:hypothetical protein [Nitrosopumilus adriaticus]AJW71449.1 hypothetical protein NADRNF5_1771 [Nitrosopumilus adriaticus]